MINDNGKWHRGAVILDKIPRGVHVDIVKESQEGVVEIIFDVLK